MNPNSPTIMIIALKHMENVKIIIRIYIDTYNF